MTVNKTIQKRIATVFIAAMVILSAAIAVVYLVLPRLVASSIAGMSPRAPERDPGAYRLRFEHLTLGDGTEPVTLAAWWIPAQPAGRSPSRAKGTVLMSHGIAHNRDQMLERAGFLARAGWQVLLFDLRGHGASTPFPLTGGREESKDFLAALRVLEESGRVKRPVVLFGLSLSGMAALRAAVSGEKGADLIEAVVADSPLPNGRSYVSRRTLGGFFMGWPGFFEACLKAYDRKTGLGLTAQDLDLVPFVRRMQKPVLYIVGEEDDLVPGKEARTLFENTAAARRKLLYVPGAGHDETYRRFRIMYERSVLEYLNGLSEVVAISTRRPPGSGVK